MVEELGQGQNSPEVEESASGGTEKEAELAKSNARIAELEQAVAGKEAEIASLKQTGQEMENRLANLNSSLAEAVASYKTAVVRATPEVIGELISGESIAAIDESLAKAKELVSKVKQGVEKEISLTRVPAGAPERTSADLSALSPREKIQYAMGRK